MNPIFRLGVCVATLATLPVAGQAQSARPATIQSAPSTPTYVTVALVDALDSPVGVVEIRRRSENADRDVILITPTTTSEDLAWAIRHFTRLRARTGDALGREIRTSLRAAPEEAGFTEGEMAVARGALRRLRDEPERDIFGVGVRQATRIAVPAVRGQR